MESPEQLTQVLESLAKDGVFVDFLPRVNDELRVRVQETSATGQKKDNGKKHW